MAAKYPNRVILGNGQTVTRVRETDDNTWNKLVDGYIKRFGALKGTTSPPVSSTSTAQKTTTNTTTQSTAAPKTSSSQSSGNTYDKLKAQGYSDYAISQRFPDVKIPGATQSSAQTTGQSTSQQSQAQQTNAASAQTAEQKGNIAAAIKVLDGYLANGTIDYGTYQLFKQAAELWNPEQAFSYANILNTFEDIKKQQIDPYFQEQASIFIDDLQRNREFLIESRAIEKDQQTQDIEKAKESLQESLAARGLLFSGEAIKQLGVESPFAVAGTPEAAKSAIPTMQPIGGVPYEGEFQKQTKAAVSSADLRYQKQLEDLQRQAERTLGTEKAGGLVPGVTALGGVTGSMTEEKKKAYAGALTGLYGQEQQNWQQKEQQQVFK